MANFRLLPIATAILFLGSIVGVLDRKNAVAGGCLVIAAVLAVVAYGARKRPR